MSNQNTFINDIVLLYYFLILLYVSFIEIGILQMFCKR